VDATAIYTLSLHDALPISVAAVPALRRAARQAGAALTARRDGPDDDPLAGRVAGDAGADRLDHADGLMADDQPLAHRVLAFEYRSEEHTSELQSPYDLVCR